MTFSYMNQSSGRPVEQTHSTLPSIFMMIWLRVAAFSAVVAALATATSPWQEGAAAESCENDCGQGLFQKSLARVGQGRSMQATNPLDKRVYLIMCWHKSGSNLIRNTMRWIFDLLGVTDACRYDGSGGTIISRGDDSQNCPEHPSQLRFQNHGHAGYLTELRAETAAKGGFKGVMTIRDPLEMVVSSYCYHHRGAEPSNSIAQGMVEMGPKEGIPEMARRMLRTVRGMVANFQERKESEMYVSHFERMTGSSPGFNQTVQEMLDFLFGDEVSDDFKRRALDAAVHEDLNRGELGYSFDAKQGTKVNHTSDDSELDAARSYLPLVDQEVLEEYKEIQKALGYAVGSPALK